MKIVIRISLITILTIIIIFYGVIIGPKKNLAVGMVFEMAKFIGIKTGSKLPVYPGSDGIRLPTTKFCNLTMKGENYQTKDPASTVLNYYANYLSKAGKKVDKKMLSPYFGYVFSSDLKNDMQIVFADTNYISGETQVLPLKIEGDLMECFKKIVDGEDWLGKDIKDIPRFPDSIRQASLSQTVGTKKSNIVSYENDASIESNLAFYRTFMSTKGWQMESAPGKELSNSLFFHKEGKEVLINILPNEETGGSSVIIMEREER